MSTPNVNFFKYTLQEQQQTSTEVEQRSEYVTLPFTKNSKPEAKLTSTSDVPMVKPPDKTEFIGDTFETTKETTKETEKAEVVQTPSDTFTSKVKEWFKLNDAQWNAMSQEERDKKGQEALHGMIEAYNECHDSQSSVAHQYALYAERATTVEEVEFLARTAKTMDEKNQLIAFKNSYKYQNKDLRMAAEAQLARDYSEFHESAIEDITQEIVENFDEKNIAIAAEQASSHKLIKHQEKIVQQFMRANSELVDVNLAKQTGQYGRDKNGKLVDAKAEINIYGNILKSKYIFAREVLVERTHKISEGNQRNAVDMVSAENDENLLNILAQNSYLFAESNRDYVSTVLSQSEYSSVRETLANAKSQQSTNDTEVTNAPKYSSSDSTEETVSEAKADSIATEYEAASTPAEKDKVLKQLKTTGDIQKVLKKLGATDRKNAIATLVANANGAQLVALLRTELKEDIKNLLYTNDIKNDCKTAIQEALSKIEKQA